MMYLCNNVKEHILLQILLIIIGSTHQISLKKHSSDSNEIFKFQDFNEYQYSADSLNILNDRPIIGVLTQEAFPLWKNQDFYIDANYVQYLQSSGARVVPIRISQPIEYYRTLFSYMNGVLLPGGMVTATQSHMSPYGQAARWLLDMAKEANDHGDYFPIWGTCLGFELLSMVAADDDRVMTNCSAENIATPLKLMPDALDSDMFHHMPKPMRHAIETENITANFHYSCITKESFKHNHKLRSFYKMLATGVGFDGIEFVAAVEGHEYPFYGVQWHPEKNNFAFDARRDIPHSFEAVRLSQYMANFFVDQARRSAHHFPSPEIEASHLIQNHQPQFLGLPTLASIYFFNFTQQSNEGDNNLYFIGSDES